MNIPVDRNHKFDSLHDYTRKLVHGDSDSKDDLIIAEFKGLWYPKFYNFLALKPLIFFLYLCIVVSKLEAFIFLLVIIWNVYGISIYHPLSCPLRFLENKKIVNRLISSCTTSIKTLGA